MNADGHDSDLMFPQPFATTEVGVWGHVRISIAGWGAAA